MMTVGARVEFGGSLSRLGWRLLSLTDLPQMGVRARPLRESVVERKTLTRQRRRPNWKRKATDWRGLEGDGSNTDVDGESSLRGKRTACFAKSKDCNKGREVGEPPKVTAGVARVRFLGWSVLWIHKHKGIEYPATSSLEKVTGGTKGFGYRVRRLPELCEAEDKRSCGG